MYLQEILEVAIGLVFMWLVISVAAMTLQEWIGNALRWRANALEQEIQEMLYSKELTKQLYAHPLIASLFHPAKKPGKKPRLPAYIPAGKFAAALFEVVSKAGTDATPLTDLTSEINAQLTASLNDPAQVKLAQEAWTVILKTAKQVATSGSGQRAVDSLKAQIQDYGTKYPEIQPVLDKSLPQVYAYYTDFLEEERSAPAAVAGSDLAMRQFRLGVKSIGNDNPKLKESINALIRNSQISQLSGEQAMAKTLVQFEVWFNDAMDRLSGSYKRKAQLASFAVGFFLALLMNVDSIYAATSLWREPTLRQAIVAQASGYVSQNPGGVPTPAPDGSSTVRAIQTIPDLQKQMQALNIPLGWIANPVKYDAAVPCDLSTPSAYDSQGNATHILGVHVQTVCYPLINALPLNADNLAGWLTKLLGLLITGAAAAQGAPFWFDILKKIINVRGSGTNPSEKPAVG